MIANKVATGLSSRQVLEIREPMFLLLIAACLIYFILGDVAEGITMLSAMLLVSAISARCTDIIWINGDFSCYISPLSGSRVCKCSLV